MMKYRIYRMKKEAKLDWHTGILERCSDVSNFYLHQMGQVNNYAAPIFALRDDLTISHNIQVSDILILKGSGYRGAWLVNADRKDKVEIIPVPNIYAAIMGEHMSNKDFPAETEPDESGRQAAEIKIENRLPEKEIPEALKPVFKVGPGHALPPKTEGGAGGRTKPTISEEQRQANIAAWDAAHPKKPTFPVIPSNKWKGDGIRSKIGPWADECKPVTIYLTNGFTLHDSFILEAGNGWLIAENQGERKMIPFTAICYIKV